jgi:hypothetical protein
MITEITQKLILFSRDDLISGIVDESIQIGQSLCYPSLQTVLQNKMICNYSF